ncbi:hypothetical protein CQA76_03285 [Campylobacter aviculae]|uniref:Uncharacterized protein n=1 Tax=Campylobacter aviculae TaxID=2510190 RepID=A0A4U7BPK3_9BACT|nr:hypothetical protein CQA76_03285 [Campylobacter aviculae]
MVATTTFARPNWETELTLFHDSNGDEYYWNRQGLIQFGRMCGPETTNCKVNGKHYLGGWNIR